MVIFFFHIQKTAGSSIGIAAQTALSRSHTVLIHEPRIDRLAVRLQRLSSYRQMFFVQGHISPVREMLSIPMKRVTILRKPLDRLISHFCYAFDRRFYDLKQLEFFRRRKNYASGRFDGEDLIAWIALFNMDDFQVRFLSGQYDAPLTDVTEQLVLNTLSRLDFIATMDNLDELFAVLGAFTGKHFNLERMPHTNKSNKSHLMLSRDDLEYIQKTFCQRDEWLMSTVEKMNEEKLKKCLSDVPEYIGKNEKLDVDRIFELLLSNVAFHEILFRIKRKTVGFTAYSMDAMNNIIPWNK